VCALGGSYIVAFGGNVPLCDPPLDKSVNRRGGGAWIWESAKLLKRVVCGSMEKQDNKIQIFGIKRMITSHSEHRKQSHYEDMTNYCYSLPFHALVIKLISLTYGIFCWQCSNSLPKNFLTYSFYTFYRLALNAF
jgi:hypothetical protein